MNIQDTTKVMLVSSIIVAGFFLRLFQLGSLPSSYTPDEVAQGYTAYSIISTGKDEWGSSNPLSLQSFGDYKLPLQTWLMVPSIKLFGLNPFAIRLPNALLSCLSLWFFYLLLNKHFRTSLTIFGISALALSPWSVSMSRLALEANIIVSLIIIGLYLLSQKNIVFSAIVLVLCLSTYHSAIILIPSLIIGLILFNPFNYSYQSFIKLSLLVLIFSLPQQISNYLASTSRSSDIAIYHPTDNWQSVSDTQYQLSQNGLNPLLSRLTTNKLTSVTRQGLANLTAYYSPQFLATNGPAETTYGMIPGFGVIGLTLFTLLIVGLINYQTNPTGSRLVKLLLFLSLILPLSGAIAKGSYSANRVSVWLPILLLLIIQLTSNLSNKILRIVIILLFLESAYFFINYFYLANTTLASGMLYGHQQANEYIKKIQPDKVIYSRKLSEPQAYYLFFQQIDPVIAQSQTVSWQEYRQKGLRFLDQLGEYQLNNVIFKEISLPSDLNQPNTLLIGKPEEFNQLTPSYTINYPAFTNDRSAIYLYLTPQIKGESTISD